MDQHGLSALSEIKIKLRNPNSFVNLGLLSIISIPQLEAIISDIERPLQRLQSNLQSEK